MITLQIPKEYSEPYAKYMMSMIAQSILSINHTYVNSIYKNEIKRTFNIESNPALVRSIYVDIANRLEYRNYPDCYEIYIDFTKNVYNNSKYKIFKLIEFGNFNVKGNNAVSSLFEAAENNLKDNYNKFIMEAVFREFATL